MKNQLFTIFFLAILVFFVGCSQPYNQSRIEPDNPDPTSTIGKSSTPPDGVDQPGRQLAGDESNLATTSNEDPLAQISSNDMPTVEREISRGRIVTEERIEIKKQMDANYRVMPQSAATVVLDSMSMHSIRIPSEDLDRENYAHFDDNPIKRVSEQPVSTFSIDVDTGSYSVVRRMLNNGQLPRHDAVRSEELINYFSYVYPERARRSAPFAVHKEIASTPWNSNTHLLHIGIKGFEQDHSTLPPANLVFLIDVSGSMQDANKLELLKTSLKLLTRQLRREDTVSMVVYAGASGVVLEPTQGNNKAKIIAALSRLQAGGSTNGAAGIELAYAMAEQGYKKGGINRVLLATDGDFNVGTVNIEQLKDMVKEKRNSGIALSTLGFGSGNYNDALMEQIADIGNGNYAYIDTLSEARKVLVEEMGSTMLTIAKDVKIQIEFNPAVVAEYRLIGYENRALNREDFNNDKVDAGEIGAGHTVTAIYEVALVGSNGMKMDPLRYQPETEQYTNTADLAFLRLRYKAPESDTSQLLEWNISKDEITTNVANTSTAFRFAAAVAAFGQLLRGGEQLDQFQFEDIIRLAQTSRGDDPFGYRGEFISLVNLADSLSSPGPTVESRVGFME